MQQVAQNHCDELHYITISICNIKNWSIQGFPNEPEIQPAFKTPGFISPRLTLSYLSYTEISQQPICTTIPNVSLRKWVLNHHSSTINLDQIEKGEVISDLAFH